MKQTNNAETKDHIRIKGNRAALCFLAIVFAIGIPHTLYLNNQFETNSVCVNASVILPVRQQFIYFRLGTTPAFKCMYQYDGNDYTAIIDRNISEEEYDSISVGDTVTLRILIKNPERARWEKSLGIRHYRAP